MRQVWRTGASMMARVAEAGGRRGRWTFGGEGPSAGGLRGAPNEPEPDLDLDHLSRQTFGDTELEDALLSLFDDQAAQILARLAAPFHDGEPARRAEVAHALKGSALAIGAFATAKAAGDYETALRQTPAAAEPHRTIVARTIEAARRAVAARRRALRE